MALKRQDRQRIVVLGYLIRGPLGGLVWHHLQYVLGLHRLGHEVLFLEDSDNYVSCYRPDTNGMSIDPDYGIRYLQVLWRAAGLPVGWAYYDAHTQQWFGRSREQVWEFCRTADVLLNLSGVNPLRDWHTGIPRRLLIDTDPAFTQIRHLSDPAAMDLARQHTHFFTFGELFGQAACSIPDDGLSWQPTRQPVVLSAWPQHPADPTAAWSTVMQWDSYRVRTHAGREYGMKSASFDPYLELPTQSQERFHLAMERAGAPRQTLRAAGWGVLDAPTVTRTPWTYQAFLQQSKGEWSIAKQGYVISQSGWFSERSAAYLASGRPVVVQDTGFSQLLPTGEGLLAFRHPTEALDNLQRVNERYDHHCRKAREIVGEYFEAEKVLTALLEASED